MEMIHLPLLNASRKNSRGGTLSTFWLWDGKAATPAVSFTIEQAGNGDMTVSDLM